MVEEAGGNGELADPLADPLLKAESYDISRIASVYGNTTGSRWWTKAWFNGNERGEPSIEIPRHLAIDFIHDRIGKDAWLARFYPNQMSAYANALAKTRQILMS